MQQLFFAEKVWSKGIWIARGAGIVFIIAGFLSITGILPTIIEGGMHDSHDGMNSMIMEDSSQDKDEDNTSDNNMDMDMDMDMDMS